MRILKCSSCGGDIQIDENSSQRFCPYCGTKYELEQPTNNTTIINNTTINYVSNADIPNNYISRTIVNNNQQPTGSKDKWVSFALCIFLGFFGAHKFYEGKIGMGIIYLLTVGLFMIGWIIDIFVILAKPRYYNP